MSLRILHVVPSLVRGGVENWLLHLIRLKRAGLEMDVAYTGEAVADVVQRFEAAGARVFPCPSTYEPLRIARNLLRLLKEQGPYQVLHCHLHRGNAHLALTGRVARVPAIISHAHLDTSAEDHAAGWTMRCKVGVADRLQALTADLGLACSLGAGDALFGPNWEKRYGGCILAYGIDIGQFQEPVDPELVRESLGLTPNAFVIGHTGRCEEVKNYWFMLDLAEHYTTLRPDAHFVFAGDGSLRPALEKRVRERGLSERIRFLGPRDDIPELLLGAFDAFLFPSLAEGLGISLVEAQAAGLPCIISDCFPKDGCVLPSVQILNLEQPLEDWCVALDRSRELRISPQEGCAALSDRGFSIQRSVQEMENEYARLAGARLEE